MLPGISSFTFPRSIRHLQEQQSPSHALHWLMQQADSLHVTLIQLGDNLALHQLGEADLQCMEQAPIRWQIGMRGLYADRIRTYLEYCQRFNAPFLRLVIDDSNYHPRINEVISVIKELLPLLKQSQCRLALENHDRFPAHVLKHIIEQTHEHWVGVCLDTSNSLGCGEGILEILPILQPYAINLHAKDILIERVEDQMGFIVKGTACGEGQIPFPDILDRLRSVGVCDSITLEHWSPKGSSPEAEMELEQAWARKGISYLNQLINRHP